MITRILFVAGVVTFLAASVHAQESGIMLSMTIDQNGKLLSSPQMLVQNAEPAELRIGDQLQIKVLAMGTSNLADVKVNVYANEGAGLTLVGSPRILVAYGQNSTMSWSSASGANYRITLEPQLASNPSKI